jgi:hypothetical protein
MVAAGRLADRGEEGQTSFGRSGLISNFEDVIRDVDRLAAVGQTV